MQGPHRRALVVDDADAVRARLRSILEPEGWTVDEAASAAEAEDHLARGEYEVVVLDFVLPDADGIQCLRSWRSAGIMTPVLGLTGASADVVLEAFIKAGAHDVLVKDDLQRDVLLAAIDATGGPPGYPEEALPRERLLSAHVGASPLPGQERSARPRRALVVDDTHAIRYLLRRHLEKDGWTVEEAGDADEALRLADHGHGLDLVLVDYLLPDMDGATLVRRLRRAGVTAPVLAMTSHATESVVADFLDAGAAGCVAKDGLNEARLREAVHGALMDHRAR